MGKVKLSIYLIKDGASDSDIFKQAPELLGSDKICYKDNVATVPKDVKNFITNSFPNVLDKLKTKSMSVAILKEVEIDENSKTKRKFVIAFGFGWSLINEEYIERDFGLITVLNCAEVDSIKKITKKSVSKNSKTSAEQMPFETTFFDFDFDGNGDILTDVTAIVKKPHDFGKISGKDSIHLTVKYNINNMEELLVILYQEYNKTIYQENFPFIKNVQLVRDKRTIKALDLLVVEKLRNKEYEEVFTAIPDLIDWESFNSIQFNYRTDRKLEKQKAQGRDDIKAIDFFTNFDENRFDEVFNAKITLLKNDIPYKEFNLKKCLLGEIEYKNECYCLTNANYYKVNKGYKQQVEYDYNNLSTTSIDYLTDCSQTETAYTADLPQGDFVKMDCKLVHKDYRIEVCDILEKNKIIHLKKYSGAASMSHFCKQASNSSILLKNDKQFVLLANNIIKNEIAKTSLIETEYVFDANFSANRYCIVFGIISESGNSKPSISFFSKMNFVHTFQTLQNIGFKCALTGIKSIKQ